MWMCAWTFVIVHEQPATVSFTGWQLPSLLAMWAIEPFEPAHVLTKAALSPTVLAATLVPVGAVQPIAVTFGNSWTSVVV